MCVNEGKTEDMENVNVNPSRTRELSPKDILVTKEIGSGSFGTVFSGTCAQVPVAIKLLNVGIQQELHILK
jgi:hypothetical protein